MLLEEQLPLVDARLEQSSRIGPLFFVSAAAAADDAFAALAFCDSFSSSSRVSSTSLSSSSSFPELLILCWSLSSSPPSPLLFWPSVLAKAVSKRSLDVLVARKPLTRGGVALKTDRLPGLERVQRDESFFAQLNLVAISCILITYMIRCWVGLSAAASEMLAVDCDLIVFRSSYWS